MADAVMYMIESCEDGRLCEDGRESEKWYLEVSR